MGVTFRIVQFHRLLRSPNRLLRSFRRKPESSVIKAGTDFKSVPMLLDPGFHRGDYFLGSSHFCACESISLAAFDTLAFCRVNSAVSQATFSPGKGIKMGFTPSVEASSRRLGLPVNLANK